jgi:hypothetical protein
MNGRILPITTTTLLPPKISAAAVAVAVGAGAVERPTCNDYLKVHTTTVAIVVIVILIVIDCDDDRRRPTTFDGGGCARAGAVAGHPYSWSSC